MVPGSGDRLPDVCRCGCLRDPLPPGALQPRLPAVPDHHGAARGPGRLLSGPRAVPARKDSPVAAPPLPPTGRGGALATVGMVVGVTALFMGFVIPFSGWGERVIIGLFGGLFLVALVKGFLHVRAGRVALHREWMIRAFAIGLSIATMRLIFIPALIMASTHAQITTLSVSSFAAAFVLHAAVAELWIRATRRSGAPRAG